MILKTVPASPDDKCNQRVTTKSSGLGSALSPPGRDATVGECDQVRGSLTSKVRDSMTSVTVATFPPESIFSKSSLNFRPICRHDTARESYERRRRYFAPAFSKFVTKTWCGRHGVPPVRHHHDSVVRDSHYGLRSPKGLIY